MNELVVGVGRSSDDVLACAWVRAAPAIRRAQPVRRLSEPPDAGLRTALSCLDAWDVRAVHFVARLDGVPVAAARLVTPVRGRLPLDAVADRAPDGGAERGPGRPVRLERVAQFDRFATAPGAPAAAALWAIGRRAWAVAIDAGVGELLLLLPRPLLRHLLGCGLPGRPVRDVGGEILVRVDVADTRSALLRHSALHGCAAAEFGLADPADAAPLTPPCTGLLPAPDPRTPHSDPAPGTPGARGAGRRWAAMSGAR